MSINFEIKNEVFDMYPDFEVAFLIITDSSGEYGISERREVEEKIITSLNKSFKHQDILIKHPYNDLYKEFYRKMGFNSKKLKKITTPIRQALRVFKAGRYNPINRVIDYCMLVEYTTLISFQVYDLEKIFSPIRYIFANGLETLIPFSGDMRTCKKGELILVDQTGVLHSAYYGNNKEKSVNDETNRYLVRIMFVPGIDKNRYNNAINKVISYFPDHELIKLSRECSYSMLEINNM